MQAGDLVSHYFSERLPSRLPNSKHWAADPGNALADEVDKLEKMLLVGECDIARGACFPPISRSYEKLPLHLKLSCRLFY